MTVPDWVWITALMIGELAYITAIPEKRSWRSPWR